MSLYLKQLRAGRDFAIGDRLAGQMANFVYVIGDDESRKCLVVDPAWDIQGILNFVGQEDFELVGALVTHYHPDHVGGHIFGYDIEGLAELISSRGVKVHVNENEFEGVKQVTGLSSGDLVSHSGGDLIEVGDIKIKLIHTPGHTPGSQCFLVESSLVSGDTLFIGGCGRVDLPGGNATDLYYSLTQVLAKLPDDTRLYPGHDYAAKPVGTIGEEKQENYCMRIRSIEDWAEIMGTSDQL